MKLVRIALLSILAFSMLGVAPNASRAQAISTASKGAEISAFGAYMVSKTDYGPHSNIGIGLGADFTIFPHFPVAPSLEVRGTYASAKDITENSLLVGIRAQRDIRFRYHPYVDILAGIGDITFHPDPFPNYHTDSGRNISYGGGINIEATRSFALKLDIQAQNWNFGLKNDALPSAGTFVLKPITAMVGVTYTIPFRILNRHSDFHH
jgi:hypothetical protein